MKIVFPILFFLAVGSLTSGCYYDNEEYLYGTCDTTSVTFSRDIKPIMDANCINCHSSGAINLTTYEGVKAKVSDSTLYKSISYSYSGASSSKNMPSAGKLDDCSINKVKAWIDEGAINN
jgi:cytochrome c5